jgi:predicted dienelactone hydrolase
MTKTDHTPHRFPAPAPVRPARTFAVAMTLLAIGMSFVRADPRPFRAGVSRITVQDTVPFDALTAYPTDAPEASFRAGPFTIAASRDGTIARGGPFPIILFSHGNGRRRGNPLIHRSLLTSLAREGFIVIAPYHPGTRRPLQARPRQIHQALDAVLADKRFAAHADPTRIGMIGFSFGGAVALISAGAAPNLAHLSAYCRNRTDDPRACGGVPTNIPPANPIYRKSADVLPVKALVLMEPFGAPFERNGLKPVDMPTLIYRAANSDLQAEGNIVALARGLQRPPRQVTVPGGHFVFVDPCPALLAAEAPAVCKDAPGVDRAAIHHQIEAEVADFLQRNLK